MKQKGNTSILLSILLFLLGMLILLNVISTDTYNAPIYGEVKATIQIENEWTRLNNVEQIKINNLTNQVKIIYYVWHNEEEIYTREVIVISLDELQAVSLHDASTNSYGLPIWMEEE